MGKRRKTTVESEETEANIFSRNSSYVSDIVDDAPIE